MVEVYWWKKLQAAHQTADGIGEHKVQAESHKVEIELAELKHVRSNIVEQ